MKHWIEQRVQDKPYKIAFKNDNKTITYKALYEDALQVAAHLRQLNIKRIGLYIQNDIDHVIFIIGAWLAHIEIVMINTKLTAKEITMQLESVDVQVVYAYKRLEIDQEVKLIQEIPYTYDVNQMDNQLNMDEIATIMFTSGTTGPAKAVPQTFSNHYHSALGCKESLGYDTTTKWLSVLPIYHISGLSVVIRSLIEGFTVIIEPKFDVKRVMNIIKQESITHISLVPQTLKWLMNDELNQPYSLQKILLGGAKLSDDLINQALTYQLPIYNSFGMTETCSQFVTASPDMLKHQPRTVGKIPTNVHLKILNKNEHAHGEVAVLGKNVMNGYLNIDQMNDAFEDGYFKTGDIGSIDDEGYVYIYDRRKDLIISGGENIYPYEIENIISKHPDIIDCVAVPIEDEVWGQVPVLVYESKRTLTEADFKPLLNEHLAKYKHPKHVYKINEIPKTSTGKLSRVKVKAWVEHDEQ